MFTFSVVIPVRPGLVPTALERLSVLDWPAERIELLLAEGENPSRQRNRAVEQASGELVYFLDDDSMVSADCLHRLAEHFSDPAVQVVGGPSLTPVSDSLLQRTIGVALSLPMAAGGVCSRYRSVGSVRDTSERELILCNLAVRRDAFVSSGGFDERLYPNEENEFLDRIRSGGGRLLYDPQLTVERSQRPTLAAFVRQMFRYGHGRARQTRIAGFRGLMPFVPLLFLFYLLSLPFVGFLIWQIPLLLYCLATLASAAWGAWRERYPLLFALLTGLIPILHLSNGVGLLAGFLLPLPKLPCYTEFPVSVRRIPLPYKCSGES